MQEKRTESPMTKIARFIVDKRKAFYLIFIAAFLFCAASINKVQINNDITSYLPAQTETRRGLTIMEEEFITLGSANVMVPNVTYQTALELSEKLEGISGVKKIAGYAGEGSNLEDVLALMDNGTVKPVVTSAYAAEFGRTQTESWSDVADIAVGESHVVGLLSDGTVIAAGSNHAGQCDVEDWENIVYLTAGRNCTLGITADGDLMMAGSLY